MAVQYKYNPYAPQYMKFPKAGELLTDEEKASIADLKSMDDVMPRPTSDAQKELLDRVRGAANEADDELLDEEFNVG